MVYHVAKMASVKIDNSIIIYNEKKEYKIEDIEQFCYRCYDDIYKLKQLFIEISLDDTNLIFGKTILDRILKIRSYFEVLGKDANDIYVNYYKYSCKNYGGVFYGKLQSAKSKLNTLIGDEKDFIEIGKLCRKDWVIHSILVITLLSIVLSLIL